MKKTFGGRLKELRAKRGFSQGQISLRTGIDVTYISKIENEKMPPPSDGKVRLLAQVLGEDETGFVRLAHIEKTPSDIKELLKDTPGAEEKYTPHTSSQKTTLPIYKDLCRMYEFPKETENLPKIEIALPLSAVKKDIGVIRHKGEDIREIGVHKGDIICISKSAGIKNNDIVVVRQQRSDYKLMKIFFRQDKLFLQPLFEKGRPLIIAKNRQNLYIKGKLTWIWRDFR